MSQKIWIVKELTAMDEYAKCAFTTKEAAENALENSDSSGRIMSLQLYGENDE